MGLGTGIERLISTSFNLEQKGEKIHNFSIAEARPVKQKDSEDSNDDPNCEKRGCVPNPRYVLWIFDPAISSPSEMGIAI